MTLAFSRPAEPPPSWLADRPDPDVTMCACGNLLTYQPRVFRWGHQPHPVTVSLGGCRICRGGPPTSLCRHPRCDGPEPLICVHGQCRRPVDPAGRCVHGLTAVADTDMPSAAAVCCGCCWIVPSEEFDLERAPQDAAGAGS